MPPHAGMKHGGFIPRTGDERASGDRVKAHFVNRTLFILNFHGVGRSSTTVTSTEQRFRVDVSFFEDIIDLVRGRGDVQLTFDDSNESDHEIALPTLLARHMTAKIFVVAHRIGQRNYLSEAQLKTLASAGMSIGCHGMHHRPWTGLSEQELHTELVDAKNRLAEIIDQPVDEAACPFGAYDRRVLGAVRHYGYRRIYTTDECPAFTDSWIQPRFSIKRSHDLSQVEKLVTQVPKGCRKLWWAVKMKWRAMI